MLTKCGGIKFGALEEEHCSLHNTLHGMLKSFTFYMSGMPQKRHAWKVWQALSWPSFQQFISFHM